MTEQPSVLVPLDLAQTIADYIQSVTATANQPVSVAVNILARLQACSAGMGDSRAQQDAIAAAKVEASQNRVPMDKLLKKPRAKKNGK